MRGYKNVSFLTMLVFIGLLASGCILFDAERLSNFKGPSWDVPIRVPIIPRNEVFLGELLDLGDEGDLGKTFELGAFDAWVAPLSGEATLPAVSAESQETIDLSDLTDLPDFEFVDVTLKVEINDEIGVPGEIELTLTAKREGNVLDTITIHHDLTKESQQTISLNLADLLNLNPDELDVERKVHFAAGEKVTVSEGDKLSIQSALRVPFVFEVPQEGASVELETVLLQPAEDAQETFRDADVSEVQLIFDVENGFPFGFELSVTFSNDPDPLSDGSIKKMLSMDSAHLDASGYADQVNVQTMSFEADREFLDMLASEPLYATYEIKIPPGQPGQQIRFRGQDELAFSAHAIFTIGINKGNSD